MYCRQVFFRRANRWSLYDKHNGFLQLHFDIDGKADTSETGKGLKPGVDTGKAEGLLGKDAKVDKSGKLSNDRDFKTTLKEASASQTEASDGKPTVKVETEQAITPSAKLDKLQDKLAELPINKLAETPAPNVAAAAHIQQVADTAATATHMDRIAPQVGTPAWDQAVGQKVVWMVGSAQQSASLTLNPPDLGPLQVVLNVSNGQADASFYAAQPEVRQALEAAMPKLRDMMSEAGVQLGQATVNAGMPNQQNSAEQQFAGSSRGTSTNTTPDETTTRVITQPIKSGQGLVDTFA